MRKRSALLSLTPLLLPVVLIGGQLIELNQNGWPFSSAASEHSALTAAALSELGLSSAPVSQMDAHTDLTEKKTKTQECSPARSGDCFLSGLCSGPAATSSLCLGCKWCTSLSGSPSFCWRGTSLWFLRPGRLQRKHLGVKQADLNTLIR